MYLKDFPIGIIYKMRSGEKYVVRSHENEQRATYVTRLSTGEPMISYHDDDTQNRKILYLETFKYMSVHYAT